MMKLAKPSITWPAALVPVWPSPMMSLVEETLSDSRRIRLAKSTVGKAEKSSGRLMKWVMVKIRIAIENDPASPRSSTQAGIGSTIITMIAISAMARSTVGWKRPVRLMRVGIGRALRTGCRRGRSGAAPLR
jgi:hypothetical protein